MMDARRVASVIGTLRRWSDKTMAEIAPMFGSRPRAVRCPVEGHPHCEIAKTGEPPSRSAVNRAWHQEIEDELWQAGMPVELIEQEPYYRCDRCEDAIYVPHYVSYLGPDGGTYCRSCVVMVECTYQDEIIDLSDPMISVRS